MNRTIRMKTVYLLLTGDAAYKLALEVSRHLAEGYQLYGSPSAIVWAKYETKYMQAVTREEPIHE